MSIIACVVCNGKVAADADCCPHCRTKDPSGRKAKKLFFSRMLGLAIVLGGVAYLWFVALPQLQHGFLK